jgi:peroxiredoxin Q/BCP
MLKIGKKAPVFSLLDQNSEVKNLKDLTGKWAVIYFYPKDDTPGCTKEACMIAEVYKDFEKKDVTVFGVSKDSPKSHLKFAEKYNLPFTLLSDPEATMIQKYEAWKEKSMFGKKYMGIDRVTYVIDPKGKIAKVYEKVDPASHALQILADIKLLQAG